MVGKEDWPYETLTNILAGRKFEAVWADGKFIFLRRMPSLQHWLKSSDFLMRLFTPSLEWTILNRPNNVIIQCWKKQKQMKHPKKIILYGINNLLYFRPKQDLLQFKQRSRTFKISKFLWSVRIAAGISISWCVRKPHLIWLMTWRSLPDLYQKGPHHPRQ